MIASASVRRLAGILTWATAFAATLTPLRPLWAQEPAGQEPAGQEPAGQEPAAPREPAASAPTPPTDQTVATALDVAAGATCLEEGPLETEVQTWLGRDRLDRDLQVHVTGDEHDAHAVSFRIVRHGKTRERRFDHLPAGCEDATAVVALGIALAIDATVVPELAGMGASPDDETEAGLERIFAAQVVAGYEVLAGGSLGLSTGIEVGLARWLAIRGDLLGQFSWSNSIEGANGVFDAGVVALAPQLCAGGAVAPRVRFELCSGVAAGLVHVQGRDFAVSRGATGPWLVASGGIRVIFDAGIAWALDVGGTFPVHVPAFQAENGAGQEVDRSPNAAGALLGVGPAFRF